MARMKLAVVSDGIFWKVLVNDTIFDYCTVKTVLLATIKSMAYLDQWPFFIMSPTSGYQSQYFLQSEKYILLQQ